jgi:hypothetical protein
MLQFQQPTNDPLTECEIPPYISFIFKFQNSIKGIIGEDKIIIGKELRKKKGKEKIIS